MSFITNASTYQINSLPTEHVQDPQSAATDPVESSAPANSGRYILNTLAIAGTSSLLHCTVAAAGYALFGTLGFGLLGPFMTTGIFGATYLGGHVLCEWKAKNTDDDKEKKPWQQAAQICLSIAINLLLGAALYGMILGMKSSTWGQAISAPSGGPTTFTSVDLTQVVGGMSLFGSCVAWLMTDVAQILSELNAPWATYTARGQVL